MALTLVVGRAKEIHQAVLTTFGLSERGYRLNQLRYDLRKLKGHALLDRDGSRYAYRLTRSHCSLVFCCVGPLPTAASIINPCPIPPKQPPRPPSAAIETACLAMNLVQCWDD